MNLTVISCTSPTSLLISPSHQCDSTTSKGEVCEQGDLILKTAVLLPTLGTPAELQPGSKGGASAHELGGSQPRSCRCNIGPLEA